MKKLYRSDDQSFIEAIKASKNPAEVFRKLNLSGNNYRTFKRRCKELGINISHFTTDKITKKSITDQQIIATCQISQSRSDVLVHLSLNPNNNGNIRWINLKVKNLRIETDHWLGQGHLKGKSHDWNGKNLDGILVENSTYSNGSSLKRRLIKNKLLINKCSACGIEPYWNSRPLTLQIDHINGDYTDNRLENLRILCPNCHSQTETYGSKNKLTISRNGTRQIPRSITSDKC